jgi:cathepsin B
MKAICATLAFGLALGMDLTQKVNHPSVIDAVNAANAGWVAGPSDRFANLTLADAKILCGTHITSKTLLQKKVVVESQAIPTSFDSRVQWPQCSAVIGHIRDQANCGSCWAFGSTEAFNDRLCIATDGKWQTLLSVQDTASCCSAVNGCFGSQGCNGGQPDEAWSFFRSRGVVTGGDYPDKGTGKTCYAYQLPRCAHHVNDPKYPNCTGEVPTPRCTAACESTYPKQWNSDKHYASSAYSLSSKISEIQTEIMTHGPITGAFIVYADFPTYKSGVYRHVQGGQLGGHAIKILGWGVEGSTPYWLVANSWNEGWGNQGYFKILRGSDECGIESMGLCAGIAKS